MDEQSVMAENFTTDLTGFEERSSKNYEYDRQLVDLLLNGDEAAFSALFERHQRPLLRVAMAFVATRAVAEEVVQETWAGVLEGLSRFEGRSSLKTWIFRILTYKAKTHACRERRSVPFSSLNTSEDGAEPAVDPSHFQTTGNWAGHWIAAPLYWRGDTPEQILLSKESRLYVDEVIAHLPHAQRQVIVLRDMEECTAKEVCQILEISESNQRVLLHRARSKVRSALANHLKGMEP